MVSARAGYVNDFFTMNFIFTVARALSKFENLRPKFFNTFLPSFSSCASRS